MLEQNIIDRKQVLDQTAIELRDILSRIARDPLAGHSPLRSWQYALREDAGEWTLVCIKSFWRSMRCFSYRRGSEAVLFGE